MAAIEEHHPECPVQLMRLAIEDPIDYAGASALEDTEFDGHPANLQKTPKAAKRKKAKSDLESVKQHLYVPMIA